MKKQMSSSECWGKQQNGQAGKVKVRTMKRMRTKLSNNVDGYIGETTTNPKPREKVPEL